MQISLLHKKQLLFHYAALNAHVIAVYPCILVYLYDIC